MPKYENDRLSFEVPSDWQDRSVISFSAPPQGGNLVPNVVMTLDHLKDPSMSLSSYADAQHTELAKQLEGLNVLGRRELKVGSRDGTELHFTWLNKGSPIEQRLLMVKTGKMVTCFTVTSARKGDVQPVLERILSSIRFKGPEAVP